MDLIGSLTGELGIDTSKARGLAGAVLGIVEKQVAEKVGSAQAAQLRASIPELSEWKEQGAALLAEGTGAPTGGGLFGAAASLLGGGEGGGFDTSALIDIAVRLGLPPRVTQTLLPLLLEFLKSRLDPSLLAQVTSAVPALAGLSGGGGGLLGALGGIL
jgi:hypothetical protein